MGNTLKLKEGLLSIEIVYILVIVQHSSHTDFVFLSLPKKKK